IYALYSVSENNLLRENFPFDKNFIATYTASDQEKVNPYSYLWPFSGTMSATSALLEATKNPKYKQAMDNNVLKGLEEYTDSLRKPWAYASYIHSDNPSDRFYDDNIWIGIDYTDLYLTTGDKKYLEKAKAVWQFIQSGTDDVLGGGIYWCEQKKHSKNTCSNAPGSVYALKLFKATSDSMYFQQGKSIYLWTKKTLQDTSDQLYFDNINLQGRIGKAKFAYNSGQMIQAAALLYTLTKDKTYLTDAQKIAEACHSYFFENFQPIKGKPFRILKNGNVWFSAVMLRGFIELYHIDGNPTYLDDIQKTLDYSWNNSRDEKGLFGNDWKKADDKKSRWLLTQAAVAEMFARLGGI
ncbi:MAG TPA: glycoside hydrolase family 76 protein, partial [Bacteroidales bacterium]